MNAKLPTHPTRLSLLSSGSISAAAVLLAGALHAAEPSFEAQTIDPNIQIGYGLAIGDVDGDGDRDILLADKRDFWWYENPSTSSGPDGPSWKKHLFHTFHEGEKRATLRDNVCIAARDINGDGKVEVAVGGNWNPGNTTSEEESGSVHFLGSLGNIQPVQLPHDPTTHRMRWVKTGEKDFALVVLPLHGRGNKGGAGENGVNVTAYTPPADPFAAGWSTAILNNELHKTHNFDSFPGGDSAAEEILVAGFEGARHITRSGGTWSTADPALPDMKDGAGEIRMGSAPSDNGGKLVATIEPMHGDTVAAYRKDSAGADWERTVLDDTLAQGHALEVADVLGTGRQQVIAGWRNENKDGKVGIKIYARGDDGQWTAHVLDDNQMACEDLKVADLNEDGKPDIIACGRATRNVIIYWNK